MIIRNGFCLLKQGIEAKHPKVALNIIPYSREKANGSAWDRRFQIGMESREGSVHTLVLALTPCPVQIPAYTQPSPFETQALCNRFGA